MLDFYLAHAFWVWVAVAAAILAVEVSTGSGWLLWPSASAAVTGFVLLALPGLSPPVALGLFAGLTIVSTLLARRFWRPSEPDGLDINDNSARLIGHHGYATAPFEGTQGRVFIDGKEWAAELEGEAATGPGTPVVVTGISGSSRLRVRAVH